MIAEKVRRNNLVLLFKESGCLRANEFCERAGIAPGLFSQIKDETKNLGTKLARRVEKNLGKPYGWMDIQHSVNELTSTLKPQRNDLLKSGASDMLVNLREMLDGVNTQTKSMMLLIDESIGHGVAGKKESKDSTQDHAPFSMTFNFTEEMNNEDNTDQQSEREKEQRRAG